MILQNELCITDSVELARIGGKISGSWMDAAFKKRA